MSVRRLRHSIGDHRGRDSAQPEPEEGHVCDAERADDPFVFPIRSGDVCDGCSSVVISSDAGFDTENPRVLDSELAQTRDLIPGRVKHMRDLHNATADGVQHKGDVRRAAFPQKPVAADIKGETHHVCLSPKQSYVILLQFERGDVLGQVEYAETNKVVVQVMARAFNDPDTAHVVAELCRGELLAGISIEKAQPSKNGFLGRNGFVMVGWHVIGALH